jgi:hypothetical protein
MRRPSGPARRFPGRSVKLTAVAVVLAGTGVAVTASSPASGQQIVTPRLHYTCMFPADSQLVATRPVPEQVSVLIKATFPQTAVAGSPIEPTTAAVTVSLPHAVVTRLASQQMDTVALTARLNTRVTVDGKSATAPWPDLTSALAPVPGKGGLALTAAGAATPVTIGAPGSATFRAAGLSFLLTPGKTGGLSTGPAIVPVNCSLDPGQNADLATIPVTQATVSTGSHRPTGPISVGFAPAAPQSKTCSNVPGAKDPCCPNLPKNGLKMNPHLPPPPPPPHPKKIITVHSAAFACAYAEGFSNVTNLHEAALIGPGLANLYLGITEYYHATKKFNYYQADNAGELDYHGKREFPPVTTTLLAFGFVPITATLVLKELGTLNAYVIGPFSAGLCPPHNHKCTITTTTIYTEVELSVSNVQVNGVPLNVGPNCRTVKPFLIKLVGKYNIEFGGQLYGTVDIPAFTGCGVGENLDSIFTAPVSNTPDEVALTQAPPCFPGTPPTQPIGCPPALPIPKHPPAQPIPKH